MPDDLKLVRQELGHLFTQVTKRTDGDGDDLSRTKLYILDLMEPIQDTRSWQFIAFLRTPTSAGSSGSWEPIQETRIWQII